MAGTPCSGHDVPDTPTFGWGEVTCACKKATSLWCGRPYTLSPFLRNRSEWVPIRVPQGVHTRPLFVVVLAPSIAVVRAREAARPKAAYGVWTVEALDHVLRAETPRIGL